ncbi:MAG: ImmA/IrrE family metallo-endopeptidase [Desulfovibrio sp.]|nr:ImmA/IrrE family metallo-endopeptidase [Desulfovibrio sp.]
MDNHHKEDIKALDELFQKVSTYRTSHDFKTLLLFIKRFRYISPYNAFLIHIQKPGSQYVATLEDWQYKFQRDIKPGARPLVILQPFGPVRFVFELGDTYGKTPFPEQLLKPFQTHGSLELSKYYNLIKNLTCDGISYNESDYGTNLAGRIQTAQKNMSSMYNKKYVKILYIMIVNKNHSKEEKFATITHELGHLYCGHLGTPDIKWWSDRHDQKIEICEFEAECVSWLVCERNNIKNPSAEYLSGYVEKNGQIPQISLENVLKASGMIEKKMHNSYLPIRKELILNKPGTQSKLLGIVKKRHTLPT